jgi:hypothetical protein
LIFLQQRWKIRAGLVLLAMTLAVGPSLCAQTAVSKEYQIKAVCLYNFAQFVVWPPKVFTSPDQPFRIGILGDDPFGTFLDETVQGEKVGGHPLVIQRYDSVEDAGDCQILFVSASESGNLAAILSALKGKSVLTVGEKEDFVQGGGMIRFFVESNKLRLKINPAAAKDAGLTISSKLLRLAQISEPGKD